MWFKKAITDYQQEYFDLEQQEGELVRAFAIRARYLLHEGQLKIERKFIATRFVEALKDSTWAERLKPKELFGMMMRSGNYHLWNCVVILTNKLNCSSLCCSTLSINTVN